MPSTTRSLEPTASLCRDSEVSNLRALTPAVPQQDAEALQDPPR